MSALYEKLAKIYDITSPYIEYDKETDFFISQSGIADGATVLDICCGSGKHLEQFRKKIPNSSLFGLDAAQGILDIARQRVPTATIFKGSMKNFSVPNKKFDLVYCASSSIQYNLTLDDLFKTLRNFRIHSKGTIIFDTRFCSERWVEGYKKEATFEDKALKVREHWTSKSVNGISIWEPVFDIFDKKTGITETIKDYHKIKLFSVAEISNILKKLDMDFNTLDINGNVVENFSKSPFFFVARQK